MHFIWEIYIIGHSSAKKEKEEEEEEEEEEDEEEEENRNPKQLNMSCGYFLSVSLKDVILWKQNRWISNL